MLNKFIFEHVLLAIVSASELRISEVPPSYFKPAGVSLVQLEASIHGVSQRAESIAKESISFREVDDKIFPSEWHSFGHIGRAGRYCGSPHFPDFNGDGFLDLFYHNHYKLDPILDWDFGMNRGDLSVAPWYTNTSATSLVSTETGQHQPMDTHGIAFLDIDRDGVLDLYIAVGGGMGHKGGPDHNAVLMWGQNQKRNDPIKFVGGRHVAEAAGVHNPDSRGRFTYFADFDSDGLLDMVFGNDVREDNTNAFGYLVFNRGNRRFEPDMNVAEYANSMILTDADGDGHADEFLVSRRNCLPSDRNPDLKPSQEVEDFCAVRPKGTTVVFKYDKNSGHMKQIAAESPHERDFQDPGTSMQSGDFDSDGKADLVVLRRSRLTFYYSKGRKPGQLPLGSAMSEALTWDKSACVGLGLRAADFDLDGKLELLVMCEGYGTHRLYKQTDQNEWVHLKHGLGAIQSRTLPLLRSEFKEEACNFRGKLPYIEDFCSHLQNRKELPVSTNGISVVDFNNDGYMDVVLAHDYGTLMFLENAGGSNRFIAIKLKGTVSNEYGIGATILLKVRNVGRTGKDIIQQLHEVNTASHETDWWGGRDDRIVFGLGPKGVPQEITVRWPGKGQQIQKITDRALLTNSCNSMQHPLVIQEPSTAF